MSIEIRSAEPRPVVIADFFRTPVRHFALIARLIQRDVLGRYRGSLVGLAWSFFTPLIMLALYTFVFSFVFKAKWKNYDTSVGYALIVFSGLIVHGVLAECMARAPALITSNANYVKKMVFPLEVYAWVAVGSAVFHTLVSWIVLLVAQFALGVGVPWTAVLFPVVLFPLILVCLGVVWFLAGLGVYYRDVAQVTGMMATVLLFLAPVFYPLDAIPEAYRGYLMINPITVVLEQSRQVLIFGQLPSWGMLVAEYAAGTAAALAGFVWFQKLRSGFADVI